MLVIEIEGCLDLHIVVVNCTPHHKSCQEAMSVSLVEASGSSQTQSGGLKAWEMGFVITRLRDRQSVNTKGNR